MKKKICSLVLALAMVLVLLPAVPFTAFAVSSGNCGDNVTWSLDGSGKLTLSGTGATYNYSWKEPAPWNSEKDNITSVVVESGITCLGDWLFNGYSNISSVELPETLLKIGSRSLSGLSALKSITLPESLKTIGECAFYGTGFESITIPSNVKNIGNGAFSFCTKLKSAVLPDGITEIASETFNWCYNLESISVPSSVTSIGKSAFYYCQKLQTVSLPEGLTEIKDSAFYNCSVLANINLPDSLKFIGGSCFNGCKKLTDITLPQALESIGYYAFSETDITNVSISENVKEIGTGAFRSCKNIAGFSVNSANENYSSDEGVLFNKDKTVLIAYASGKQDTSFTVPETVTQIEDYAFSNSKLVSVVIPETVTKTGDYLFDNSSSLESVTLPSNMTKINDYMFYYCKKLTSVEIPSAVTEIGDGAFYRCSSITTVTLPDGLTEIGENAFEYCSKLSNISIPETVVKIGEDAFFSSYITKNTPYTDGVQYLDGWLINNYHDITDVVIKEGTKAIIDAAFSSDDIETVKIPASVKIIGDEFLRYVTTVKSIEVAGDNEVFSSIDGNLYNKDATALLKYACGKTDESFEVPAGVTEIGVEAFKSSKNLKTVVLPDGLKNLCDSAFESCELLQEINLPDGLETIGSDAFWWCSSLENIEIPESVTSVGSSAFLATALVNRLEDESEDGNSYISNWLIVSFSRGSKTVIAPGTVGISGSAFSFEGKEDYTDIILPDGLKYIGNDAFWYCSNLQSIKIPDSVETVGTEAFGGCAKLTDVTVPAEAEIADNAFSELSQDACVFVKARVNGYGDIFGKSKVYAVQCGDSAFWEIDGDTLHIYGTGSLDDYADGSQMPWNDFIPQIRRVVIDSGIIVPNGKIFSGLSLEEDIIQNGKLVRKSGGVEITVDPSIESIGAYAFGSDVTSALIGDGVKEIDPNAFDDVSSLTVNGYSGSAAYAFTQANPTVTFVEFKVVKGCVTGSNGTDESKKPTMQDAMLLFNGVMSGDTTHFFCNAAADFNSDSVVSLVDVLGVLLAMSET